MPPFTLESEPVDAGETERKTTELLNEFFKHYFSGAPHVSPVSGNNITFPVCDLLFNQTQLPSPGDKPQVHTVFTDMRPEECWLTRTVKLVTVRATLSIFVRVSNQGAIGNKADFLCRQTADQVKEIFQAAPRGDDTGRYALAQGNVRHCKVQRGPAPVGTVGFQVRLLIVSCDLQYKISRE